MTTGMTITISIKVITVADNSCHRGKHTCVANYFTDITTGNLKSFTSGLESKFIPLIGQLCILPGM